MARIAEEEIERLKQEVSIERLAEARGVKLVRHGADLVGLCPFHEDHSPSLVISPKKNLWNCLGACRRAVRRCPAFQELFQERTHAVLWHGLRRYSLCLRHRRTLHFATLKFSNCFGAKGFVQ